MVNDLTQMNNGCPTHKTQETNFINVKRLDGIRGWR